MQNRTRRSGAPGGSSRRGPASCAAVVAPLEIAERVRVFLDAYGTVEASHLLKTSRETLLRVAAGLTVRRGSVAGISAALAERDREAEAREGGGRP